MPYLFCPLFSWNSNVVIKIYDVLGKQAASYTVLQPETKLPIQQLPSGMYMYSLEQRGAVLKNGKLVKE